MWLNTEETCPVPLLESRIKDDIQSSSALRGMLERLTGYIAKTKIATHRRDESVKYNFLQIANLEEQQEKRLEWLSEQVAKCCPALVPFPYST